jgi:hypothetical protein
VLGKQCANKTCGKGKVEWKSVAEGTAVGHSCHINRIHSLSLILLECKAKVAVPVAATNAYRRRKGIAPFILQLGTRQIYVKTAVCVMDVSIHINFYKFKWNSSEIVVV